MVLAQEIIGRPYLMLFGVKVTTIVWILIAVFLALVFSRVAFPHWWRRFYKASNKKATYKDDIVLSVSIIAVVIIALLLGSILGFNAAYSNLSEHLSDNNTCTIGCTETPCENLGIACEDCICNLCDQSIKVTIPTGG